MSARNKIEKLEELIKERIDGELIEQKVESLVAPGENFGSVIYKVDFKVRNGEKIQVYHGVAKCTPPNRVTQELFNTAVTFKSEIAWYTTVIPTIREFQREHGVEQADFFQRFYGARISLDLESDVVDLDAVLLTENLKPLGYKNIDRHIGFDLKTSKAILRDLATFHAVPIAIKLKNRDIFDKNLKPYLPGFEIKEEPGQDAFKHIKDVLREIPEIVSYIDKISIQLDKFKPAGNKSTIIEPWGSICHNDFWINNIMVKEGDDPKTMFLDFQVPEYGPIANDVLFFLVVSVAQEVIKEHMDELIVYYWNEFLRNLKRLDIDHPAFTYEEFLKRIDEAARLGQLGHALFFTFLVLTDKGHTHLDSSDETFKKEDMENAKLTINDRHKEKYRWLVLEFVKRGWI